MSMVQVGATSRVEPHHYAKGGLGVGSAHDVREPLEGCHTPQARCRALQALAPSGPRPGRTHTSAFGVTAGPNGQFLLTFSFFFLALGSAHS